MADVVCMGELLVDMVGELGASLADTPQFLKAPGGAPANVAVGLSRLGTESSFVGAVGDDPFGDWLRATLQTEKVDTANLKTVIDVRTTIAFVATRADGRKEICFYRNPGADAQFGRDDFDLSLFDDARIFHCGSVSLSQNPCRVAQLFAAREARNRGLLVSFDPNWRPSLWPDFDHARQLILQMTELSDVVKIADEEWEFVTGTADFEAGAAQIRALGPRLVIITRGEQGAYFDCQSARGFVPGFRVETVDTLGAGDAFVAALLSRLIGEDLESQLNEGSLRDIVRFSNACGALATATAGAIPSLPNRGEVAMFLEKIGS